MCREAQYCAFYSLKVYICSWQIIFIHENHPGTTAEEYYRRSLAAPFLDHLISKIETWFTSYSLTAMKSLGIVHSSLDKEQLAFWQWHSWIVNPPFIQIFDFGMPISRIKNFLIMTWYHLQSNMQVQCYFQICDWASKNGSGGT